ncbi:MAG: TetR/AcrR family transcriptional regulator [Tenericutes bacterium]|nr:TetR/AcrR family transcriptional regulator [Mycoplasmatota bacterium]
MKEEKKDLRIVKTKNALYLALVDLMKDKTFEEIKVSEICNKALVNRSTFYAHFDDKYEFLVDFLDTFKDSLTSYLDTNKNILNTKEYYMELIKLVLTHIEDKKNIYSAIMVNNRNGVMMDIIIDVVNKDIRKRVLDLGSTKSSVPADIIIKFYLGAIINVGIDWITENKYTKEEVIGYFDKLLPDNIDAI